MRGPQAKPEWCFHPDSIARSLTFNLGIPDDVRSASASLSADLSDIINLLAGNSLIMRQNELLDR